MTSYGFQTIGGFLLRFFANLWIKSIYYYEKSLEILGEENDMELRFVYTLMSEFEKAKLKNAHGDNEENDSNQL